MVEDTELGPGSAFSSSEHKPWELQEGEKAQQRALYSPRGLLCCVSVLGASPAAPLPAWDTESRGKKKKKSKISAQFFGGKIAFFPEKKIFKNKEVLCRGN